MGIRMDNKMSLHPQAIEVTKQVNNRLFNLRKLWELATMEMMNLTAQSMLMSKMFYLLEVTLGEKKVIDKLKKTQNAKFLFLY